MDGDEWVIDTQVLVRACNPNTEADLDAQAFIHDVRLSHHISLDFQRKIEEEYRTQMKWHVVFRLWFDAIWKSSKVMQRDGRLDNRHREQLVDDLHFDRDDLPFVAVSSKGISKFLVADESDYTDEIRNYLTCSLGITVFDSSSALKRTTT